MPLVPQPDIANTTTQGMNQGTWHGHVDYLYIRTYFQGKSQSRVGPGSSPLDQISLVRLGGAACLNDTPRRLNLFSLLPYSPDRGLAGVGGHDDPDSGAAPLHPL